MGNLLVPPKYTEGGVYFRKGTDCRGRDCVYSVVLLRLMPVNELGQDCVVRTMGQTIVFRTEDLYAQPGDIHLSD